MQATSILLLLAALMPASGLRAQTTSPRHLVHVSAKKKPAAAGGFGAATSSTPKKKKKTTEDDEPGLARPWDATDGDATASEPYSRVTLPRAGDGEETRAQKRGSKKIGKRGAGAAPQPSGGMSAGVKLN